MGQLKAYREARLVQEAMANTVATEVVVTTKNTLSLTLGLIAVVFGALALVFGWIPFLGLLAIPVAGIGGVLALLAAVIALAKGFKGMGMPLLGVLLCGAGVVMPIAMTGGVSRAVAESADRAAAVRTAQAATDQQDKDIYILNYLTLYDVEAKYMESLTEGRIPGVLFKLRNGGDRTLEMIEVTVVFHSAEGAAIAEETYRPVQSSAFGVGDHKPLKPGYIWQLESGRFYNAGSVPSEWREGSIDARITDIRFAEEGGS